MADQQTQGQNNAAVSTTPNKKWYRRRAVWFTIGAIIIIVAIVVGYWYMYLRGIVSTDDAYVHGNNVSVSSKILGRIVELTVDEGDTITQGEVLVYLDSTDLKAQEVQAEAAVGTAESNVTVAQVALQRAKDDFNRAAIQYKSNVIPLETYQHSQQALEMAQAQYDLTLAQVTSARAQLQVDQTKLTNTKIYAPFTGVVARRWVLAGDVVQPGQPIFAVYAPTDIWVEADFEETKLRHIQVGDLAQLSIDAYPGHKFEGNVLFMGAAAASQFSLIPPNNASGNFTKVTQRVPVRLSIRDVNSDATPVNVVPGMSVTVTIRTSQNKTGS
jgi:membrane fusion protein (multidrug efflux system)